MKKFSWIRKAVLYPALCWAVLVQAVVAADKPVAVVSFAGYDALISDLNYVGELAGTPQLSQSLEGILALVTRAQGLVGLDKSKPIGAAVSLPENGQPTVQVFVPVTDVDKLLDALQGLIPQVEDLGDGFSRLRTPKGPPIIMKRADGWAFFSDSKDNLADLPKNPAKLLGTLPDDYDLAVQLNVQNVPAMYKQLAVGALKDGFEKGMKQNDGEDDATYKSRRQFGEHTMEQITSLIDEVDHITFGFAIDEEDGGAYFDTSMNVVPGGKLAKQFAEAKKNDKPSKFAGFADPDAVANVHFHTPVMAEDAKMMLTAINAARPEAAKKIDESNDLNDDQKKSVKGMVNDLFDVVEATINGGQFNGGFGMWGEGPFDMAAGGLFVDAKKLEAIVKKAVDMFGSEADFPKVKLDAANHEGVSFHTLSVPIDDGDDDTRRVFGEKVNLALGFGTAAAYIAVGENPIKLLKGLIDDSKKSDDDLPPAQIQVKLGPIVKLGAEAANKNDPAAQLMSKLLSESDDDHVSIVSDFIENGSMVRFEIEEGLIQAIGKAAVLGMQRGGR